MSDFERRVAGSLNIETREQGEGQRLVGYAAVFHSQSEDLGGFREQIAPGAFASALAGADVRALWNHDNSQVLGRTAAGTLTLAEDDRGLRVEVDLPDTQAGRDARVSVERGDVSQMSFAFRVRPGGQEFAEQEDGTILRTLTDVELFEVSPVTFPAYKETVVDTRALDAWQHEERSGDIALAGSGLDQSLQRMKAIRDSIVAKEQRGADWCEFRNLEAAGETAEILIYDAIGLFGTDPKRFVQTLGELAGRNLHLRINSPGGSVMDGAAIYNALRNHDGFVTVDIDGMAASMAGIIAMAGQRIRMNQNAFFMAHNASGCVLGDARAMRREADLLDKISRSLAKTLAIRSGKDHAEVLAMMDRETWFDADEAREAGIVDEILHETGAHLRHHDLSHFRNVPEKLREQRRAEFRGRSIDQVERELRLAEVS